MIVEVIKYRIMEYRVVRGEIIRGGIVGYIENEVYDSDGEV